MAAETYGAEVVTFTADLGQGEELEPARAKAELLGIKPEHIFIEDLREEFVRDFVFPMFRANAQYEGLYLLGTSIARPLIAKRLVEIAREDGADAIAHGATGKGNDQVRFELSAYALEPDIKIIAPWREWSFASRTALIGYAEKHQIPIPKDKRGEAPFSTDANLLHTSSKGKVLEDPAEETPGYAIRARSTPKCAPDKPTVIEIGFKRGDPVSINGEAMSPATLLAALNSLRPRQRNRPARPGREPLRRDEVARHVQDARRRDPARRSPRHREDHARPRSGAFQGRADAEIRRAHLQRLLVRPRAGTPADPIDKSQELVTGRVRLKLYKGGAYVVGRDSPHSLYDQELVTFEEGAVAYDHNDAAGFIKLNALRLRTLAKRKKRATKG